MAESTLALSYNDIRREVGRLLGFGRIIEKWSTEMNLEVDSMIKRGLHRFYTPQPLQGETHSHEWSFLKPTTMLNIFGNMTGTLTNDPDGTDGVLQDTAADFWPDSANTGAELVGTSDTRCLPYVKITNSSGTVYTHTIASVDSTTQLTMAQEIDISVEIGDSYTVFVDADYNLPDDFGGIDGEITYQTATAYPPLTITSQQQIRSLRQNSNMAQNARPRMVAIRPRDTGGATGQRFEMMVWPRPTAAHVLQYKYVALLDMLATGETYPAGGAYHSETILESCLAAAEEFMIPTENRHMAAFMERLKASVMADRSRNAPEVFGYNADRSDAHGQWDRYRWRRHNDVTFNFS